MLKPFAALPQFGRLLNTLFFPFQGKRLFFFSFFLKVAQFKSYSGNIINENSEKPIKLRKCSCDKTLTTPSHLEMCQLFAE